jgi:hypothetical protein
VGTRLGMGAVAELVCQAYGAVSHSKVPRFRPDTMPECPCGGRRQIVASGTMGSPDSSARRKTRVQLSRDPKPYSSRSASQSAESRR